MAHTRAMANPFHAVIVGAGPAGLSAALSLVHDQPVDASPLHITVLEARAEIPPPRSAGDNSTMPLGGAVNLTPLALRYLDRLGVGARLRPQAVPVSAIELVTHRKGALLGRLWPGVDAVRVQRQLLIETLRDTIRALPHSETARVQVVYGARLRGIEEFGSSDGDGGVRVTFDKGSCEGAARDKDEGEEQVLEADIILGCDGIHSQVRTLVVDPAREKRYAGKCCTYGYITLSHGGDEDDGPSMRDPSMAWLRPDGRPLVTDTSLVTHGKTPSC